MLVAVASAAVLVTTLGAWAAWHAIRDRPVVLRQLVGAAVVEVALVVQAFVAFWATLTGHELTEAGTFWGYVVVALCILPLAAAWALVERTRWSSVVLLVACVAVLAMQARIAQLWEGAVPA